MAPLITVALQQAVDDGVFPGAVLLVQRGDAIEYCEAVGSAALTPARRAMTRDTLFDLASLTKPIVTATAVLLLVHRHRVSLDTPAAEWLPDFRGGGKEHVTLFHLLNHSSGLPAWKPYYKAIPPAEAGNHKSRQLLLGQVMHEPLVDQPGRCSVYSDLGFILLGVVVEQIDGRPLDQFCREEICDPLGMRDTAFRPMDQPELAARSIAATEECRWRGRLLQGEVQDQNCYALGGVSGHAGLFATAEDLSRFLGALITADGGTGRALFDGVPQPLVRQFLTRQATPESSWALGWDTPSGSSSAGRHFSPRSCGHLGYSGTSLWVDRDRGWGVLLLTNRVHPSSRNVKITAFRPRLHDLVAETYFLPS